jgi:hypothetical protein
VEKYLFLVKYRSKGDMLMEKKGKLNGGRGFLVDCSAVSPLLGFVLLLMILMTAMAIIQSTAVPQWNREVEAKHLDSLKYEVADIGRVVAISASTGNPAKVVLNAGVSYPNYYVLFSPSKASTTINAVPLAINISGNIVLSEQSAAIVVEPNYYYYSRVSLIYEHSAVLREEMNSIVIPESDQSAFSRNSIHLAIIKPNFYSFATTETASIVLVPESYGGSQLFSGSIEFECYDENTAKWWNNTLSSIYGHDKVSVNGRTVKLENLQEIYFSISVFSVYTVSRGEIILSPSPNILKLLPVSKTDYSVYFGSTVMLVAKVIDTYGNPVKKASVTISDPCAGASSQKSDENGLVIYYFNANCIGDKTVTLSVDGYSLNFNINVQAVSGGGGGSGGTFVLEWYGANFERLSGNYEWDVGNKGNLTSLYVRVLFDGNAVPNIPIYFAFNNSTVVSVNDKSPSTNLTGWAYINLTANMNGTVAVVAVVSDSSARLNITVTGVGPANLPPTQPNIQTDKKYYRSGETITATAYGSMDPNGDRVTYYYRFLDYTSGALLRDWDTGNTYTVTSSEEGHVIRVYAKACDSSNSCSIENYVDVSVIKVITIRPSADSYVYSGSAGTNYGNSPQLISGLGNRADRIYRIYIKFDLSEIPANAVIFGANLYLYKYSGSTGVAMNVHRVLSGWEENTINWNNKPSYEPAYTDRRASPSNDNWMFWNVTRDVRGFVDGSYSNHGWYIKHNDETTLNTRVYFRSKEYTDPSQVPYLYIEYALRVD